MSELTINVKLETLKSDFGYSERYYSCDVDGTHFTNSSIITLRDLLRRKFGEKYSKVNFIVDDQPAFQYDKKGATS
jgi:hypothetical protein